MTDLNKIDNLCAEKVFGWSFKEPYYWSDGTGSIQAYARWGEYDEMEPPEMGSHAFSPTRNPADTERVMLKMVETHPRMNLVWVGRWECEFFGRSPGTIYMSNADDWKVAVCIAALKALGVEVPE